MPDVELPAVAELLIQSRSLLEWDWRNGSDTSRELAVVSS